MARIAHPCQRVGCERTFHRKRALQRFCSRACASHSRPPEVRRKCAEAMRIARKRTMAIQLARDLEATFGEVSVREIQIARFMLARGWDRGFMAGYHKTRREQAA